MNKSLVNELAALSTPTRAWYAVPNCWKDEGGVCLKWPLPAAENP